MHKAILVEDDEKLRKLTQEFLNANDIQTLALEDGSDLEKQIALFEPELLILDIMLPGKDGLTLCREIRSQFTGPILFMSAKGDNVDQVIGLELGADDYIVKPVEPRLLLARVHALLRRVNPIQTSSKESNEDLLRFGQLTIDKKSRQTSLKGETVQLTSHEFDMLWLLAKNASKVVDRDTLYTEIIGREYDGVDRSADVRISRLRKKLHDDAKAPFRIKTIWGKGFFFVSDAWD
ncbi:response regulator [Planctobacterium marinum]|uniref:DNA-binding response regulator n=1 Tax=Planctobacterium marinum TaxID=1631968 RepID=A0AA48HUR5_9ALTE|nr:DNA-binding response regulator [Planctobacterium marinum]